MLNVSLDLSEEIFEAMSFEFAVNVSHVEVGSSSSTGEKGKEDEKRRVVRGGRESRRRYQRDAEHNEKSSEEDILNRLLFRMPT